jgi:hypothetical protein
VTTASVIDHASLNGSKVIVSWGCSSTTWMKRRQAVKRWGFKVMLCDSRYTLVVGVLSG